MKKLLLCLALTALTSCSPLAPRESGETSSSTEATSSSSSESSSASQQESSSEPTPESGIYLHDAYSHLYVSSDVPADNPFLKTYRHKKHEDVPYVDLDEFQHVRRYLDPSLKFHSFTKLQDGRYDLASSYFGHCYFDVKAQKAEIVEAEAFYGELSRPNGSLYFDPCLDFPYLQGSPKSKYLTKGGNVVYDLAKFDAKLASLSQTA